MAFKTILLNPTSDTNAAVGAGIPVGLLPIASHLKRHGCDVELFDAPIQEISLEDSVRQIADAKPDLVGITSMTPTFPSASRAAAMLKELRPECRTVAGGVHATFMDDEALDAGFDYVCRGEGEELMLKLIRRLESGDEVSDIDGLSWRLGGETIRRGPANTGVDLHHLPPNDYAFLPMAHYARRQVGEFAETFSPVRIVASRGCNRACNFCNVPLISDKRVKTRPIAQMADEVEVLHKKHGIQNFKFADDLFTYSEEFIFGLMKEIRTRGLEVSWECETRMDLVDGPILDALASAGCESVWYGVETTGDENLKKVVKGLKMKRVEETVDLTLEKGINPGGFFLAGIPWESKESFRATLDYCLNSRFDTVVFSIFTPFPGSPMFKEPEKYGMRDLCRDYSLYTEANALFDTEEMGRSEIVELVGRAYIEFYLRPGYILEKNRRRRMHFAKHVLGYLMGFMKDAPPVGSPAAV